MLFPLVIFLDIYLVTENLYLISFITIIRMDIVEYVVSIFWFFLAKLTSAVIKWY